MTWSRQGIVNTTEGKVVRAFHRFTLVDQSGGYSMVIWRCVIAGCTDTCGSFPGCALPLPTLLGLGAPLRCLCGSALRGQATQPPCQSPPPVLGPAVAACTAPCPGSPTRPTLPRRPGPRPDQGPHAGRGGSQDQLRAPGEGPLAPGHGPRLPLGSFPAHPHLPAPPLPRGPQDPNARNCHGYRKFVKRALLEDPTKGYLLNDTLVIRYTIELVVSSGEGGGRRQDG